MLRGDASRANTKSTTLAAVVETSRARDIAAADLVSGRTARR
jgi:hypothetical protein